MHIQQPIFRSNHSSPVSITQTMEAFRRIMAAKQKKRSPTKKERDQAQKALKEREALLKELDEL